MENINFERKKGVSIVSREAAEARRQYFLKKKSYWEQLEKKKGLHKVVKNTLLNMRRNLLVSLKSKLYSPALI